jgi:hypothetical protein
MRYHFPVLFPSAIAPHFFVGELFGCRKPLAFRSQLNDAQDARSDNADAHSLLLLTTVPELFRTVCPQTARYPPPS